MDENSQKKLDQLITLASQKEFYSFEVSGVCNNNGELIQRFPSNIILKDNVTYNAALVRLSVTSFFPNISETNNRFYYSNKGSTDIKVIQLDSGAYEIEDLNKLISAYTQKNITIALLTSTGKTLITLADGWKVYFNKPKTFRNLLGFLTADFIEESLNMSDTICDVVDTQSIYVNCNIVSGAYLDGMSSNILYSFDNKIGWGRLICLSPNPLQECPVIIKHFNELIFRFHNEDKKPINFMKSHISLKLQIRQL